MDDNGDPIIVVTKKTKTNSDWFLTGEIRVRFPSKRSALSAEDQHGAPIKGRDGNESRVLTHDDRISQTIIYTDGTHWKRIQ
jgi:hypothetical protein